MTLPRTDSRMGTLSAQDVIDQRQPSPFYASHPGSQYVGATFALQMALGHEYGYAKGRSVVDEFVLELYNPKTASPDLHRHLASTSRTRRLVYYTDEYPPQIVDAIDNPFCPQVDTEPLNCAIVVTKVCVVLEEGDDPEQIEAILVTGLRSAVLAGAFMDRVPPAYLP
jgi:hypothetical protein